MLSLFFVPTGPVITLEPSTGRWSVIGVVSWAYGCARDDYPGVYARVTKVVDWIKGVTKGTGLCNV